MTKSIKPNLVPVLLSLGGILIFFGFNMPWTIQVIGGYSGMPSIGSYYMTEWFVIIPVLVIFISAVFAAYASGKKDKSQLFFASSLCAYMAGIFVISIALWGFDLMEILNRTINATQTYYDVLDKLSYGIFVLYLGGLLSIVGGCIGMAGANQAEKKNLKTLIIALLIAAVIIGGSLIAAAAKREKEDRMLMPDVVPPLNSVQ